ncbi:hypothetical protein ACIO13_08400 [Streptomyces sp. NPDC087425]|uniref:hypothetical protein n=1 Tax=Streptomyces sp. NPDC087425 TaxID=3365787 RepID=UPI00382756F5
MTPGISTFKGQERALRADRLGTSGLLLFFLTGSRLGTAFTDVLHVLGRTIGTSGAPGTGSLLQTSIAALPVPRLPRPHRPGQRGVPTGQGGRGEAVVPRTGGLPT